MSNSDPMGRGRAVALSIPVAHVGFLRRTFADVRSGLLEDLADHSERLQDPSRSQREADAFGRLLKAVDARVCVPDADASSALAGLAQAVDDANQYQRVITEHAALHGLIDQLDSSRPDAQREEEG